MSGRLSEASRGAAKWAKERAWSNADMTDLLLLRHGESMWNAAGRWQGWADPPLSPRGEAQARSAAELLADARLRAVVSSDLQRAQRTAEIITERLGLGAVVVEPAVRERDVGDFSGLTRAEIDERWPGMIAAWRRGEVERAPNGEGREFIERVMMGLDAIAERFPGQRVLVVTHGGVIRTTHRHLGGEPGSLANLAGLWLHLADGAWRPGDEWVLDARPARLGTPPAQR